MGNHLQQHLPNFGIHLDRSGIKIEIPVVTAGGVEVVRLPAHEAVQKQRQQAKELHRLRQERRLFRELRMSPKDALRALLELPEATQVALLYVQRYENPRQLAMEIPDGEG